MKTIVSLRYFVSYCRSRSWKGSGSKSSFMQPFDLFFKLRLRNVNIRKHQHAEITYGSNFLTYLFTILAVPNTVKYSLGINKKNQKLQVISSHQKLQVISSPNHISKHSTALCCHKFIRLFCTLFISFLFNGLLQSISF